MQKIATIRGEDVQFDAGMFWWRGKSFPTFAEVEYEIKDTIPKTEAIDTSTLQNLEKTLSATVSELKRGHGQILARLQHGEDLLLIQSKEIRALKEAASETSKEMHAIREVMRSGFNQVLGEIKLRSRTRSPKKRK